MLVTLTFLLIRCLSLNERNSNSYNYNNRNTSWLWPTNANNTLARILSIIIKKLFEMILLFFHLKTRIRIEMSQ